MRQIWSFVVAMDRTGPIKSTFNIEFFPIFDLIFLGVFLTPSKLSAKNSENAWIKFFGPKLVKFECSWIYVHIFCVVSEYSA